MALEHGEGAWLAPCPVCASDDVELYEPESDNEPQILHCHECGADTRMASS